jgi:hypothetical protein
MNEAGIFKRTMEIEKAPQNAITAELSIEFYSAARAQTAATAIL